MESMERLIIKSKAGSLYFNDTERGLKLEPHEIEPHQRRLLLKRLYAYEDTELTPEEILELKERDTAKKVELINGGVPICPVCGRRVVRCYDFCPDCGQRLEQ